MFWVIWRDQCHKSTIRCHPGKCSAERHYGVRSGVYAEVVAGISSSIAAEQSAIGVVRLANRLTLQHIDRIGDDGSLATIDPGTQLEDRAARATIVRIGATARYSATTPKSLRQTVLKCSGAYPISFLATSLPDSKDIRTTTTAGPEAPLRVLSPSTPVISLGTEGTHTIFAARAIASAQPERRSLPVTMGQCRAGSQLYPNLVESSAVLTSRMVSLESASCNRDAEGYHWVELTCLDCGGCALSSDPGVDCTKTLTSGVKCIAGRCVAA